MNGVNCRCGCPREAHRSVLSTGGTIFECGICCCEGYVPADCGGNCAECRCAETAPPSLGWHVIAGDVLLRALRRVAEGESPDLVYADHERIEGDA